MVNEAATETLVFGVIQNGAGEQGLVFIPKPEATRLAAIHAAISGSQTWGEFFATMPLGDSNYVRESRLDCDECVPDPSEKFDVELLPGFTDGDWPDWPEQKMLDWPPAEICQRYGRVESSVLNGPYLTLDVTRSPEIVDALERAEFELRFDEELVRKACGS